jgi:hypothetical protein
VKETSHVRGKIKKNSVDEKKLSSFAALYVNANCATILGSTSASYETRIWKK